MFAEDLTVFFQGLDSRLVTFTPLSGSIVKTCYFDNAFFDIAIREATLVATQPRLIAIAADVAAIPRGTPLTIEGISSQTFYVLEIQFEGTGTATVTLSLTAPST